MVNTVKIDKNKRYDIFINTVDGLKDEYINVELFIDDIFIHVVLTDGRNIGYPIINVSRINFRFTGMTK